MRARGTLDSTRAELVQHGKVILISTVRTLVYKEGMDQWLLAVTSNPAAKGSAKDLEVAGAGPETLSPATYSR